MSTTIAATSLSATSLSATSVTSSGITLNGNLDVSGTVVSGSTVACNILRAGGQVSDSTSLTQGSHICWNNNLNGEMDLVCKSGTASGGINFYLSTGNNSTFSTGKTLLAQITSGGYLYAYRPSFRVYRSGGWSVSNGEVVTKSGTTSFERTPGSSGYSSSTGTYTVPVAGVWHFSVYVRCADGAGSLALKPATSSAYSIPNSDNSYFVPTDGGNRRTMMWSETIYMSSGMSFMVYSGQATTIQDFVLSGHYLGD